jgi:hypothetical protein
MKILKFAACSSNSVRQIACQVMIRLEAFLFIFISSRQESIEHSYWHTYRFETDYTLSCAFIEASFMTSYCNHCAE